jgi:hypothetical protein
MNRFFSLILIFSFSFSLQANFNKKVPFQQQVNHVVHATLIDSLNVLDAKIRTQYINNSPDTLHKIFMHLWINAFKDNKSAFAQQLVTQNNFDFHFAGANERGFYSDIDFTINGKRVIWGEWNNHLDIIVLYPDPPVAPGDTIYIHTPFKLNLPSARFSRPGHFEQEYFVTQWYPKPAVFNHQGWHPMPYLHTGEFFSEFGNFELFLTLPANYIVASSGLLQNKDELLFLDSIARKSKEMIGSESLQNTTEGIASSEVMKTLHFRQQNLHEFAWFASKKFHILRDKAIIAEGDTVFTWVYFSEDPGKWNKVNTYLKEILVYMSEKLGPYPWKQMTVVQGMNSNGSDMEYPAITLIGKHDSNSDLERVIAHETIHNWFYGILASNERRHPWIDEGFTTYYENRFFNKKYPDQKLLGQFAPTLVSAFFNLSHIPKDNNLELDYLLKARQHLDQPIGSHSEEFTLLNYYFMAYQKAALSIRLLEEFVGQESFDKVMSDFFDQWKFKHPGPGDIRNAFESEVQMDLSWFFDDLINTSEKLDLKITSVSGNRDGYDLTIKNKGSLGLPFQVAGYIEGEIVKTIWHREVIGISDEIFFPGFGYEKFTIDPFRLLPDLNRQNNTFRTQGLFKRTPPLELQFLGSIEDPEKSHIYWSPVLGYNSNNGLMPGLALYNFFFPVKPTEVFMMPMYSPQKDNLTGKTWLYHTLYPRWSERIHAVRLGSQASRFGMFQGREGLNFQRIENLMELVFKPAYSSDRSKTSVTLKNTWIHRDRVVFIGGESSIEKQNYYVNELNFHFSKGSVLRPGSVDIRLEQAEKLLKSSITTNILFPVNKKKEGLSIRLFAGAFLKKPNDAYPVDMRFRLQGMAGRHNYTYDHTFAGRNDAIGSLWGNQIYETDGGFKYPTPLGQTWDWLASVNMKFDIPHMPVRLFADIATYHGAASQIIGSELFPYVTGLQFHAFNDIVNINFPVFVSGDLKRTAQLNKLERYWQKITFTVHFDKLNPFDTLKKLNLLLY